MANRWLRAWLVSCNWILLALIVAVAVVRSMRGPLIAGAAVVALAALATAIAVWYNRPSAYGIAQRLDNESHLGDRVSTAVHFWTVPEPSDVILRQRGDALKQLAKVEPAAMFPLQMPAKTWRTGALLAGLGAFCAFHAVYGPAIPRLTEKAVQSHALATAMAPLARALDFARSEKRELGDLVASNDRDKKATEVQKPLEFPPAGEPNGSAKANPAAANAPTFDMGQALKMANANNASLQNQAASTAPMSPNQQSSSAAANSQTGNATEQQGGQSAANGQQSLGQRALQALENLMNSALSGQQNNGQTPQNQSSVNSGATAMQAMSGSSQMTASANQAAQGQTSNSQGSQNQMTRPDVGKHTGAGNGTSPWQPRTDKDPTLAGNTAKEHEELQMTGYSGAPSKERADVAPGTAQIPLQDVAPQTVTTVNGAGQDSVPPRYRQYVQNYFQHSEK